MICPNCGFQQPDGRVCAECNAIIEPNRGVDRVDPGSAVWAEPDPEETQEEAARPVSSGMPGAQKRAKQPSRAKDPKSKGQGEGMADRIVKILVTTGATVQGKTIAAYKGPVTATAIVKTDVWDPFLAAVREVAGLRNAPIHESLKKAQSVAFSDLKIEAAKLEADAVIGTAMRLEGLNSKVLLVYVSGTAVSFRSEGESDDE